MEIKATSIVMVPINKIIPNDKNNNIHTEEQKRYARKIFDYQGFRAPLLISNRTGKLVAGHLRLEIAKEKGVKELPCMYQDFDSEEQEYAHLTADNALAAQSSLDFGQINSDILELGPFDIELLGIKDFVIEPIEKLEPQCDEDEVPEVVHPITRKGDIWLLGNHRLMCGDSTMIDDVEKLMSGEKADMVFTDPPYKLTGGGSKGTWGKNLKGTYFDGENYKDSKKENLFDVPEFSEWINLFELILKKDNEIFIMSNVRNLMPICSEILDAGYKFHNILVMKKDTAFPQKWYSANTEFIFYMYKGRAQEPLNKCQPNWFDVKMPKGAEKIHVSQKPVGMIEKIISNHFGQVIFEPFTGSGSTLIACEKTNRKCYGMELDEKYCDVIINRWQNFTGKKATLELTGQSYEELKLERDNQSIKS